MCAGAVLTFGRVHVALTVEGRDQRRHVSAVDARGPQDPTTDSHEPVAPARAGERRGAVRARAARRAGRRRSARARRPADGADGAASAGGGQESGAEEKQD